jgi:hypothetical protein
VDNYGDPVDFDERAGAVERFQIAHRNWCGDVDESKSKTSKRPLALGYLDNRYRARAAADNPL